VGTASWAESCGQKNKPGVYTSITEAITWIQQQMEVKNSDFLKNEKHPTLPYLQNVYSWNSVVKNWCLDKCNIFSRFFQATEVLHLKYFFQALLKPKEH